MHRSTQHSIFGYFLDLFTAKQASDLLNKIVKTLMLLIVFEDTAEGAVTQHLQARGSESPTILGGIKAMLCVAIAIVLALFLGQLN